MSTSRRDFQSLLPVLAAASLSRAQAEKPVLASKVFRFEDLPVRQNGQNKSRAVFDGTTVADYPIELHITELAPGLMPHAAHQHAHAEMIMIEVGTLEITIDGKATVASAGSVVYVAPNAHHGWKNVGQGRARYFVMALGRSRA